MARGGKRGRLKRTSKNTGPSSMDRVKKMKYMDEMLGIIEFEVSEDEQEKAEGSEQRVFGIAEWVNVLEQVTQDISCGKEVNVLVLKKNINETVNQQEEQVDPVRITEDDIEEEVSYWKPSIVGYVAGANPPLHVLEGFVRRIWKQDKDEVGMIAHGIFLIRFVNEETRDSAMNGGFIFFDKKPFVMQLWNVVDNFAQTKFDLVPTWIQLKGLEIKYWGQRSLFKIV